MRIAVFIIVIGSFLVGYAHSELIAVYEFDDVTDSSGNGLDGELKQDAVIVDGKFGLGLEFTRGYFLAHDTGRPFSIVNNFGITAWIKSENDTGEYIIGVASFDESGMIKGNFSVQLLGDWRIVAGIQDMEGRRVMERELLETNNVFHDGKWHHIVFSATDDHYRIYVDGNVIKESNNDRNVGFDGDTTLIRVGYFNVHITSPIFVDDVGFFTRGLSEYEVSRLYNGTIGNLLGMLGVQDKRLATTWAEMKRL